MARALLARFHSLGDVILATGVAQRLLDRGEEVDIATSAPFAPVFEGLPVGHVWTPDLLAGAGPYDRVIDLQANATSRRLLRGHGPARTCSSRAFARRWIVFWGRRAPRPQIPHAVQRYAEAAACGPAAPPLLRPRVRVTPRDLEEARAFHAAWEITEGACVGLAEGASRRMKRWPPDRVLSLAEALASRGIRSLRFLEPDGDPPEEPGLVRAPLRPLKALLGRCSALVTNDSGIMHLAVGLGVPVVSLFGSTVLEFGFGPLGERDVVLERDLACRPCGVHGGRFCWQGHARCLRGIEVEEVLASTLDLSRGRGMR